MKILDNYLKLYEEAPPEERLQTKGVISTDFLPKFEHINARNLEEAALLLKTYEGRAALIAGGQDLLRQLKNRVRPTQPKVLINIKTVLPKLDYLEESQTGLAIGSLATLRRIETSPLITQKYNILAQAAHATRALQYRNVATIGGDLCQQVRCWYYRASGNAFFCYRKGGDKCYAGEGDNRYHSILGGEVCFATCPSDTAPALVALEAKLRIVGTCGERSVSVEDFFQPLGTILEPDEIVTEVQIPTPKSGSKGIFLKFGLGNTFGPVMVSLAVVVRQQDKICRSARIVLGAVSPVPWRAAEAEQVLTGERINQNTAEGVAQAALAGARPLRMNGYKVDLVKALVKHALIEIAEKT